MAYNPNHNKPYRIEDDIHDTTSAMWAANAFEALIMAYDLPDMTMKELRSTTGTDFGYATELKVTDLGGATSGTDNLDIFFSGHKAACIRVSLLPMLLQFRNIADEDGRSLPEAEILDQAHSSEGKLPSQQQVLEILDGSPPGVYDLRIVGLSESDRAVGADIAARWEWDGQKIVF